MTELVQFHEKKSLDKVSRTMTSPVEIIKIASLVPTYNGNEKESLTFIAALKALKAVVEDANNWIAVCVVVSKLRGKALTVVGENPSDIQTIIEKNIDKMHFKKTPEDLVEIIKRTTQKGTAKTFGEEIVELTRQLENAYLEEETPTARATEKANRAGMQALVTGLRKERMLYLRLFYNLRNTSSYFLFLYSTFKSFDMNR